MLIIVITVFKIFCFLETFLNQLRLLIIIITVLKNFCFLATFLDELRLKNVYYYYCVQDFLFS